MFGKRSPASEGVVRDMSRVPGLSARALTALQSLAAERDVYAYQAPASEEWNIWIEPSNPAYNGRWSVPAWNAWVEGQHSRDVNALCMCAPCQEARWRAAVNRFSAAGSEHD